MINLELESKLTKLTKEYNNLQKEYADKEDRISYLQDDLDELDAEMSEIEERIKSVKRKMLTEKVDKLNITSDDKFINCFVKASLFCEKDEDELRTRPVLGYVKLTNNSLIALDGFRMIMIKCDCIPEELKNTRIKWDVRENFKDNIADIGDLPDTNKIYQEAMYSPRFIINKMVTENFYKAFNSKPYDAYKDKNHIILEFENLTIALNKEFIDTALICLKDSEFNVYLNSSITPIVLENNKVSILVLPVRMVK